MYTDAEFQTSNNHQTEYRGNPMNLSIPKKQFFNFPILLTLFSLLLYISCSESTSATTDINSENVVEVTATHDHDENLHLFELNTQTISSGWTTFQFRNASHVDHFFVIYQVPDAAITAAADADEPLLEHWFQGVTDPFQTEFNPYAAGEIEYAEFVDNLVAHVLEKGPWFFDPGAPPMGGPGFTAAGETSKTTVNLEPGEYIVECYVKDENEQFHSYLGMLEQLTVNGEESAAEEPEATVSLTISSTAGITANEIPEAGSQIVEVFFEDQATYGHLLGHNVQLVKLSDNSDEELIASVIEWMDWTKPGSLVNRAPEGAEFLGGAMEMTGGSVAYIHADFEPGDYAWVAEIPDPIGANMLKTFTVSE